MSRIREKTGDFVRTNDRRPVRGRRSRARPEGCLRRVASGKEVGDGVLKRAAAGETQVIRVPEISAMPCSDPTNGAAPQWPNAFRKDIEETDFIGWYESDGPALD